MPAGKATMAPGMPLLAAIGLSILFVIGAALGLVFGLVLGLVSLVRGARAVHFEGVVCRARLTSRHAVADLLAGPALVRLSGALERQDTTGTDVLGLDLRLQPVAKDDAAYGDQDLLLGSFESFLTVARDRARTDAGDYLANQYSTVTPWWLTGLGPVILRLVPPPPAAADRGSSRLARLDADLAAGRAGFTLMVGTGSDAIALADVQLTERIDIDDRRLRASMFRQGRRVRPLGLRNGIRATVYPISQLARRLRGG
jgi:hypothetical protein